MSVIDTSFPTDGKFNVFFRLSKVDENLRQVWGRATEEVPDKTREILDYASSKPNFQKWSDEAQKRSDVPGMEPSLGNIREMHGETAAGKVIDIQFKDDEKAIDIGTFCADDSTWQKILKGVLTGFSIGGRYARRWMDHSNPKFIRYTAEPVEISYVDVPAVPTALYTFIKTDGAIEMKKIGEPALDPETSVIIGESQHVDDLRTDLPKQPLEQVPSGEQVKAVPVVADEPNPNTNNINDRAVMPISQPRADPVEKTDGPDWFKELRGDLQRVAESLGQLASVQKLSIEERTRQETILKSVGDRVGIVRRPESPLVAPNGQVDFNQYGDPANWLYACDKAGHAAAVDAFNKGDGLSHYKPEESHVLGRRIARLASRFGDPYLYSPKDRKVRKKSEVKKMTEPKELIKVELDGIMAQLQSAVDVAADKLGVDPADLRALLAGAVANANGNATTESVDTVTQEPQGPMGEQQDASTEALKAAVPATTGAGPAPSSSSSSSPSATATGTSPAESGVPSSTPAKTATATAATPSGGMPAPSAATSPDMSAAMKGKMDALEVALNKILVKIGEAPIGDPAPVAKSAGVQPVGDLQAILAGITGQQVEDPVMKTLMSGDLNAFKEASVAAGSKEQPNEKLVVSKAYDAAAASLLPQFQKRMGQPGFLESIGKP